MTNINFFPSGCECGGIVEFDEKLCLYRCCKCGNFVFAHREASDHNLKHEPLGYLADAKTNLLRKQIKKMFNRLWLEEVFKNGRLVKIIHVLYPAYLVWINKENGIYGISIAYSSGFVQNFFTGYIQEMEAPEPIDNRTKSHIWLSEKLDIPLNITKIDILSYDDLIRSRKILIETFNMI